MKKFLSMALTLVLILSLAACGEKADKNGTDDPAANDTITATDDAAKDDAKKEDTAPADDNSTEAETVDRAGNGFTMPEKVETVISMAPSITQTLLDLGCKDMLIAADTNSTGTIDGLAELPAFDMMTPDVEKLAEMAPDVVFVSGLSMWDGSEPYKPLQDMGITFVVIPTSATIEDIYKDISFIGGIVDKNDEADKLNADLKAKLDEIAEKAASIPEDQRKTVYFEIASAPNFYSTGANTYLDEMISLVGGRNVLADQEGWISMSAENIAAADPDVILTNTNYIPDAVGDLLAQEGWSAVKAIANKDVYYIDNMSSSLPNENIVLALEQMGAALYPDVFAK